MFTLEGTLNSIWDFFARLLVTFYHSFFRSKLFLNNLINNPDAYISAKTYLFISIFTNYFIYRAFESSGDNFLGFLDVEYYQKAFSEVRHFTVIDIIVASAPYAVISYFLITLLVKCLRVGTYWKNIFTANTVYLFASAHLLFCLVLLSFIITESFVDKVFNGEGAIDMRVIILTYLIIGLIILVFPIVSVLRRIPYLTGGTRIKFLALQLLALGSIASTLYPFFWGNEMTEWVNGKVKRSTPIKIYNSRMTADEIIIDYHPNNDSTATIGCSFVIENKSKKTCYFFIDDSLTVSFKNGKSLFLDNDGKAINSHNLVQLIKSGDFLAVYFDKHLDKPSSVLVDSLFQKRSESIPANIYFNLEVIDPTIIHGIFGEYSEEVAGVFNNFTTVSFRPK